MRWCACVLWYVCVGVGGCVCSLWLGAHVRGMCGCVRVGECEHVEDDCVRENEKEGERETNKSKRKRERD